MLNSLTEKEVEAAISKPLASDAEIKRMRSWLEDRIAKGKRDDGYSEVVTLTPVLASLLLERNEQNRPLNKSNGANLATDVAEGRFMFNGESIVVSRTGKLLDGQHRCQTVLETKKQIRTTMVFGPLDEARFTIDIGKAKSAANFLSMQDRKDASNLAATIRNILMYRTTGTLHPFNHDRPTTTAVVGAAEQLRGVETSLEFVADAYTKRPGSKSVFAFCHWVFAKKAGRETADEFMRSLADGEGLRKGDPIYYCREKLATLPGRITPNSRAELIFRCWNAWRLGHKMNSTRLMGGKLPKVES